LAAAAQEISGMHRGATWALLALVVAGLQWRSGTYRADFSSHPDEAAHAVSALLLWDYAATGFPAHPLRFAERFYVHYPKVAIGHWPPAFHAMLAGWMLLFGRTKAAMLVFQALVGVAVSIGIYELARRECGELAAGACALLFSAAPIVQRATSSVMPDLLLCAVTFAGAASYGEFLKTGRKRYRLWFAGTAMLALAIHGRGIVLLLVPIFAACAPAMKRIAPLRLILGAAAALTIVGLPIVLQQSLPVSPATIGRNMVVFFGQCTMKFGWVAPFLALIPPTQLKPGRWRTMVALVAANWFFFSIVNVFEDRYLLSAGPPIFLLAARGWQTLAKRQALYGVAVAALVVVVLAADTIPGRAQPSLGYTTAIEKLPRVDRVSLVAGPDEGAFIAAMALHDVHLEHIVLRGSKLLARSSWSGRNYQMVVRSEDQIDRLLQEMHVGTVILGVSPSEPHVALLERAIERNAGWREVGSIARGVRVFQSLVPPPVAPLHIRIENPGGFNTGFEVDEP
jgi:hypothetical protein